MSHLLDYFASRFLASSHPFFWKGWGSVAIYHAALDLVDGANAADACAKTFDSFKTSTASIEMGAGAQGHFLSPVSNVLPPECRTVRFTAVTEATRGVLTGKGTGEGNAFDDDAIGGVRVRSSVGAVDKAAVLEALATRPVAVHLAATGDESMRSRVKFHALPLLDKGIASIVLEIPYYGSRRSAAQRDSSAPRGGTYMLPTVADIFAQTAGCVHESLAVLGWLTGLSDAHARNANASANLSSAAPAVSDATGDIASHGAEDNAPARNLGICGVSYGGAMAAATLALCPVPLRCVSLVPSRSGAAPFAHGVLRDRVAWDALSVFTWADPPTRLQSKSSTASLFYSLLENLNETTEKETASPASEATRGKHRYLQLTAPRDMFIPYASARKCFSDVSRLIPGKGKARIRLLRGGHATAIVFGKKKYVEGIVDVMTMD